MFYQQTNGHGLPHDPFKAIIAPRPIGWISTVDTEGKPNLAPYSFFGAISSDPYMVIFSSEGLKDSALNCKLTGEFVCNLVTLELADAMNETSANVSHGVNEFHLADLEMSSSQLVKPPRVSDSPAALECRVISCNELYDLNGNPTNRFTIVGQVVGIYINDHFLNDGFFDTAGAQVLARCGYREYVYVKEVFEIFRPSNLRIG